MSISTTPKQGRVKVNNSDALAEFLEDKLSEGSNITLSVVDVAGVKKIQISSSGGGGVDSVNGQTGVVVLDPDDLDDSATLHKFVSQAEIDKLAGVEDNATADQTAGEIEAIVNHDNLLGYVANEHLDWTQVGAGTIDPSNYDAGDVDGPASSTDNAIARYDGPTGKAIQNSNTGIDDTGRITGYSLRASNNGTTAAPAYSYSNDSNTGQSLVSSGVLGWIINGSQKMQINTSGLSWGTTSNLATITVQYKDHTAAKSHYSPGSTIAGGSIKNQKWETQESTLSASAVDTTMKITPSAGCGWSIRYTVTMTNSTATQIRAQKGFAFGLCSTKGVVTVDTHDVDGRNTGLSWALGTGSFLIKADSKGTSIVGEMTAPSKTAYVWHIEFEYMESIPR